MINGCHNGTTGMSSIMCYVWLKVHQNRVLELNANNLLMYYILINDLLIIQ